MKDRQEKHEGTADFLFLPFIQARQFSSFSEKVKGETSLFCFSFVKLLPQDVFLSLLSLSPHTQKLLIHCTLTRKSSTNCKNTVGAQYMYKY